MVSKNQHFSGRRKSRDYITNEELSHTADSIWQIINEPLIMGCLSCMKSELKSTIYISKSRLIIFLFKEYMPIF